MATFGGQLGVSEKSITGRKNRMEEEEAKSLNTSDKPDKEAKKEDKPAPRPPMSKKWYE